jgi:hypothetical protein
MTGNFSRSTSKWFSRSLLAALLSAMSCLSGLTPSISVKSGSILDFKAAVSAQDMNPEQLRSYARSLLAIEPLRQQYYNSIKQQLQQLAPGESVPAIICSDRDSVNNLPKEIRGTAVEYCEQSIAIVEDNNLTIQQFNQITESLTSNPDLLNRITQELLRLQMPTDNLFQ